jgi:hypothetical protein
MIEIARTLGFLIVQGAKFAQMALVLWIAMRGRRAYAR